jgi:hypothetical protein
VGGKECVLCSMQKRMCSLQIECVVEFLCGGCGVGVGAGGAD